MHGVLLDTSSNPTQWAPIALGLLALIYVVFVRPMQKRKKDPLARKPNDTNLAQQRAVERDMTALLVEYEKMMRTMASQLENRTVKLELLIRDADERLGQLRQVSEYISGIASGVVGHKASASELVSRLQSVTAADRADAPPASAPLSGVAAMTATDEPPRHGDVYALADQGLSYRQIARRLDRPDGEIELILALRPKLSPVDATSHPAVAAMPDVGASTTEPAEPRVVVVDDAQGMSDSANRNDEISSDGSETPVAGDITAPTDQDLRREAELALSSLAARPPAPAQAVGSQEQRSGSRRRKKRR